MNIKSCIIVFMALLCVNATRCSSSETAGDGSGGGGKLKLTAEWTSDMRVSYYEGGGMLNEYTRYEIYTDSASYTMHEDQVTNVFKLKFSKTELDAIAKIFYENNFPILKATKHEVIYDKGTRSISIWKGTEGIEKGDDATSSYTGENGKVLAKIQNDVMAIMQKKLGEQRMQKIQIIFDQSITKTKYEYKLQFAPSNVFYDSKVEGRLNEVKREVQPGSYNVNVYTYKPTPGYGTKYGPNGNILFSTTDANTITVSMTKDSTLVLTPEKK